MNGTQTWHSFIQETIQTGSIPTKPHAGSPPTMQDPKQEPIQVTIPTVSIPMWPSSKKQSKP